MTRWIRQVPQRLQSGSVAQEFAQECLHSDTSEYNSLGFVHWYRKLTLKKSELAGFREV